MLSLQTCTLALLLSQEPTTSLEEELAQEAAQRPPAAEGTAGATTASAPVPAGPPRVKGADDVNSIIRKLPSMSPAEREQAILKLQAQWGQADFNPVLPSNNVDLDGYLKLTPHDQARVVARGFFEDLIAGNPSGLLEHAGFPFYLEGRRVDRPDELQTQWSRSLRSRRADLLKLHGVEVLTPSEMERKYGKPPARIAAWPLKTANTFVAVGNLSGKATVVLLRPVGATWQVIAFHD